MFYIFHSDPKVKRNFCRKCSTAFTPNKSCDIEIVQKPKEHPYVNCICKTCGVTRKYILNPSHKLWGSNPGFILEIYETLSKESSEMQVESSPSDDCKRMTGISIPSTSFTDNDPLVSVPS